MNDFMTNDEGKEQVVLSFLLDFQEGATVSELASRMSCVGEGMSVRDITDALARCMTKNDVEILRGDPVLPHFRRVYAATAAGRARGSS